MFQQIDNDGCLSSTPDYPAGTPDGSRGEVGVFLRDLFGCFSFIYGLKSTLWLFAWCF